MAAPRNSPPEARFPACAGMTEAGAIGAPLDILLQQIINGLVQGSVYALVALGYTMVYGILGLINFAHGEVVMIGAMMTLSALTALLGLGGLHGAGLQHRAHRLPPAAPCAAPCAADHRDRRIHRAAESGDDDLGTRISLLPAIDRQHTAYFRRRDHQRHPDHHFCLA